MEIGNLVKYEDYHGVNFGIVFNIDTDDNNKTIFWIWWDDNDASREYPDDEAIQVIQ